MLFILCSKNKRQINPELSQVLQFVIFNSNQRLFMKSFKFAIFAT